MILIATDNPLLFTTCYKTPKCLTARRNPAAPEFI
jgi:hypothetical protein